MILVNILSLVALASAILMLMLSEQDASVDRSLRFREASQAAVLARAGEMSAAVALRRDAVEAPGTDHLREPWAAVIEREAAITGGTFTLSITDAQARFNLNNLAQAGPLAALAMGPLAAALGIDAGTAARVAAAAQEGGEVLRLSDLRALGIDEAAIVRLAPLVTTLPEATNVNINTASEPLIALLTGNPAAARMLVAQRDRAGFVTQEELGALGLSLPQGVGFTSNYFWVRTTVTIGDTPQTLTSLLRRTVENGEPKVVTLARWRGATPPDALPPL